MKWNESLKVKLSSYIIFGLFLILAVSSFLIISTVTSQQEELAYQQSIEMAKNHANQIDADEKANKAIAQSIANSMAKYESGNRDEVSNILKNLLVENPHLLGTYVGYEPNVFDGKDEEYANTEIHDSTGRFIPYWNKLGGSMTVEPLVDYESSEYYQLPKSSKADVITEPYLYEGTLLVSYVSPIINDDKFVGIEIGRASCRERV